MSGNMRYVIRRRFSLKTEFEFFNETGDLRYRVEGKILSWGYNLTLRDANGQAILAIRERSNFRTRYEVRRGDAIVARITSEGWFRSSYRVEIEKGDGFSVQPNFWGSYFAFVNQHGRLAELIKPFFAFSRPMELTISDERHELMLIAASVAVLKTIDRSRQASD